MSDGTAGFPRATSASLAFLRATGLGLASATSNSEIPGDAFFVAVAVPDLDAGVMADPFVFQRSQMGCKQYAFLVAMSYRTPVNGSVLAWSRRKFDMRAVSRGYPGAMVYCCCK